MKPAACVFLLFFLLSASQAQEKEKWQHVQILEESIIDLDVSNVTFGTDFTGRVRFRISLDKSHPVPEKRDAKYKSVIETIEYQCYERRYRLFAMQRFDGKGKSVDAGEFKPATEWKAVHGFVTEKLFTSACKLIEEKKRNP